MWLTIITLLLVGLIFMCFELFVPGGILGIIGVFLMGYGVWLSFEHYGSVQGFGVLIFCGVAVLAIIIFGIKVLPHTSFGKQLILADSQLKTSGYNSESFDEAALVGQEGIAESDLRPAGIANFGDQRLDVVTEGEFVEAQQRVKIVRVNGNRVVVETV